MANMHALLLIMLLTIPAVSIAQHQLSDAAISTLRLYNLTSTKSSTAASPITESSCLFDQKDVSAQDMDAIKRACDPSKEGDPSCKDCLCTMYRAITKAFSATQGRLGTNEELNNCQDTVEKALGKSAKAGKTWQSIIASKTLECFGFLMKAYVGTENGSVSEVCAGFPTSAAGIVKPWAPFQAFILGVLSMVMLAFLA